MTVALNSVARLLIGYVVVGDGVTFTATSSSGDWPATTRLRIANSAGVETAYTPTIATTLATWTLTVAEVTALIGTRTSGQLQARITHGTGDALRGILAGPLTLISEWTGVRGTQSLGTVVVGPAGPTAVSTDAGNAASLGTDGLLYVSASQGEVTVGPDAPATGWWLETATTTTTTTAAATTTTTTTAAATTTTTTTAATTTTTTTAAATTTTTTTAAATADLTYLASRADDTSATTYTFAAVPLGTEDAARSIIIALATRGEFLNGSSVTVTVGGVSATLDKTFGSTASQLSSIYRASVPTGTTGDIVVTFPGGSSMTRCMIGAWRAVGTLGVAATRQPSGVDVSFFTTAEGVVPDGGFVVATSTVHATAEATCSWSGADFDGSAVADALIYMSNASSVTPGAHTVAGTWSSAASACTAAVVYYSIA